MISQSEKLVAMANQIGRFFVAQPGGAAAHDIASHLQKFWDPAMRAAIIAYLENGGAGLDPAVREAVGRLKSGIISLDTTP